jgi:hypothetical protein
MSPFFLAMQIKTAQALTAFLNTSFHSGVTTSHPREIILQLLLIITQAAQQAHLNSYSILV